ncbi:DUF2784 family protein [Candidatus Methylomirabilis sp.]|uniref:DUF2784 family protein n=1 Tax=Candidatus Methylomirabilis sp. TaxID=2032687 RepID=UPI003076210A
MRIVLRMTDRLLYMVHMGMMIFCILGWTVPAARRFHLLAVMLIAFSWFVFGAFRGYGYCVVTDLQWRVKKALGESPLHASFVKYQLDRLTGRDLDARSVEVFTQACFYVSAIASIYVNFAP